MDPEEEEVAIEEEAEDIIMTMISLDTKHKMVKNINQKKENLSK